MKTKILELRDEGTFISVLCIDLSTPDSDAERYHMRRCGYPCNGKPNIGMTRLSADGDPFCNDPYYWGGRTLPVAHNYIIENWDSLGPGDVVDVEYILGETKEKKVAERFESEKEL